MAPDILRANDIIQGSVARNTTSAHKGEDN